MRIAGLVVVVAAACCKPQPLAVGPDPPAIGSVAPPFVTQDASSDVAADATTLPPIDRRCSVDADCDWLALDLTGPTICCPSCATTIASRTWTAAVRSICGGALPSACYPLACPLGITTSRCDGGTCVPKL
jgi:hypothetical protein